MPGSAPKIPNEIVLQIFNVFATTLSTRNPALFPWFLGHVCSTWRNLFLSMTTEFWHTISIVFSGKYESTINVVRFFLEREPAVPFSFYMGKYYHNNPSNPQRRDCIRQTMEMLVDHSMRWKKASIQLDAMYLVPLIRIKNRLPLLQELDLCTRKPFENQLFDVFQNAPSLDVIRIDSDIIHDWKFDLLNLKAIDVSTLVPEAPSFFAALPQMTKLEQLIFNHSWPYSHSWEPSNTGIVLPNLKKLACRDNRWLRRLEAPSLEDLSIDCKQYDDSHCVLSFLSRSSCELNISSLDISRARASTVVEIVRNTPQITYLRLAGVGEIGNVYKQLTIPTNPVQEPLARHVQSLYFSGNTFFQLSSNLSLLYDLISSRTVDNRNHKRLQKLEMGPILGVPPNLEDFKNIPMLCKERGVQFDC